MKTKSEIDILVKQIGECIRELDEEHIQALIGNKEYFLQSMSGLVKRSSQPNGEVVSSYHYQNGYSLPHNMKYQVDLLRHFLPGIGGADEDVTKMPLPPRAEGWFAIPRWNALFQSYDKALQELFALMTQQCRGNFGSFCVCKENRFLRDSRSEDMLNKISEAQNGNDILIVPAQFGLRHRGRSVMRAQKFFETNEFGLGLFEVGFMLLTHPTRLSEEKDDLSVYTKDGYHHHDPCRNIESVFVYAIGEGFRVDSIADRARENYGLVTAFLP